MERKEVNMQEKIETMDFMTFYANICLVKINTILPSIL